MAIKRIYNPSTEKYYAIRQKNTSQGKKGQILGLYKCKKLSSKYASSIRKLADT